MQTVTIYFIWTSDNESLFWYVFPLEYDLILRLYVYFTYVILRVP